MIDIRYTRIVVLLSLFVPSALFAQGSNQRPVRQICSLKADGSDLQIVSEVADSLTLNSTAVSPTGSQILFSSWDDEDGEIRQNSRIARLALNETGVSPLEFELGDGAMPSWSPRGKRIALTRFSLSRGVWLMKSDGTNKVLLDRRGANAKWSPNGHMIAYAKTVRESRTIAIYDMVEDRSFELWENAGSPFERIAHNFAWSPDSRQICLRARRPSTDTGEDDDTSEIVTVFVDDPSRMTVHETCEDGQLPGIAWHPDGKRIVFSKPEESDKPTQLFWFDPTKDESSLPFPGQDTTRNNSNACWTPDGNRLIFVSNALESPQGSSTAEPVQKTEAVDGR